MSLQGLIEMYDGFIKDTEAKLDDDGYFRPMMEEHLEDLKRWKAMVIAEVAYKEGHK